MKPGSDEARAAGCKCPVLDNGHGHHPYRGWDENGQGLWAIRGDCPIHGWEQGDSGSADMPVICTHRWVRDGVGTGTSESTMLWSTINRCQLCGAVTVTPVGAP